MKQTAVELDDAEVKPARLVGSWRLFMAVIGQAGFMVQYCTRVSLSVAIVCMVNQTAIHDLSTDNDTRNDNTSSPNTESCSFITFKSNNSEPEDGPFIWNKDIQGHILGSFYYGYLLSQIPGGMLAERYGSKRVIAISMILTTAATLLSPIAAEISYIFLIFLRILSGFALGGMFPMFHSFWSKWAPPYERSKLAGITYSGAILGTVIAFPVSGLLCQSGLAGGWPSIFYVFGSATAIWVVLWMGFVSDTPSCHWKISENEKRYIVRELKGLSSAHVKKEKVPWLDIIRSMPVWAIVVANFTSDWGFYTLIAYIPSYMREVLKFDVQSNGLYSSLPYIVMCCTSITTPFVADKLLTSKVLSVAQTRKLVTFIGMGGAASCLVVLAFLDCTQSIWAVVMLTIGVGISSAAHSGYFINHIDIAPKYAGTLLGISNCVASTSGFLAPVVVAAMTQSQTIEEWQRVFFLSAGIYVIGAMFYTIFSSGTLQPWAQELETIEEEVELRSDVQIKYDDRSIANGIKDRNIV